MTDRPPKAAKPLSMTPKAIQMRELRRRRKALFRTIASPLVDWRRLGEWDDHNEKALQRAVFELALDWAEFVTREGNDPVPRTKRSL